MRTTVSLTRFFAAALLALALVGCTAVAAAPRAALPGDSAMGEAVVSRHITVVGSGEVSLIPDVARVNLGVEASADTVGEAKAEVDRQVDAILSALKELGIAAKDIQTSSYSIYLEREPVTVVREGEQPARAHYRVSNMLEVTIRDIDTVGAVLDAVVEAGANQVYGVQFTVEDDDEWQSQARAEAVADARARAAELAELSGVELGEILTISEVIGGGAVPVVAYERAAMAGGIAPGELQLSTQVQVTFAIQ